MQTDNPSMAAITLTPRALAEELCLIIEGAYVTKHVTGNRNTIDIARRLAHLAIATQIAKGRLENTLKKGFGKFFGQ